MLRLCYTKAMEIGYIFKATCPSGCGDLALPAREVSVYAPSVSAVRIGMKATYLANCPSCRHSFGGYLENDEVDVLTVNFANINMFSAPLTPDIEPNFQPRLTRRDVKDFAAWIGRGNLDEIYESLNNRSDFQ